MQHFILHCGALEQTRHSFINEVRELVGSLNNEKLLGLILDRSTAGVHEENHDSLSFFLSILSRSNFDHHLRCGGWLNLNLAKGKNIRDGPLKLFTRSCAEAC